MMHNYFRLSFKDNPFRCSYILPDGITSKKGFVRDMDEARRYCSLPSEGELYQRDGDSDTNKFEDKKKPELSQNVTPSTFVTCKMLLGII